MKYRDVLARVIQHKQAGPGSVQSTAQPLTTSKRAVKPRKQRLSTPVDASPAAFVAKTTAFGGLFGTLCVVFDPTIAFSFTLVATVLLAAL